jgi:hypothetical protein
MAPAVRVGAVAVVDRWARMVGLVGVVLDHEMLLEPHPRRRFVRAGLVWAGSHLADIRPMSRPTNTAHTSHKTTRTVFEVADVSIPAFVAR